MAELKISFTLGERDLRHFRRELARAMGSVDRAKADQITAAAVSLIARVRSKTASEACQVNGPAVPRAGSCAKASGAPGNRAGSAASTASST